MFLLGPKCVTELKIRYHNINKIQYILKYVHIQGGKHFPGWLSILKNNKMLKKKIEQLY